MSMFFSQAKDLVPPQANIGYKGAPSGYAYGTVFNYQPSNMNQNLAKGPLNILILPYAEVQFILSELAFKGIISGNAQTFYENGVKATIEQWGSTMPANYFANPNVAYNGTLERIMLQKYVALFFVDQQQWFEKRRTGYPVLPNNGGLLNNGIMPSRLMYPPNPRVLNTTNYQAAVQLIIPSLFISAMAFSQTSVSGYVFEDINKNQKKENQEKGIEGVAVSNGSQVVLTDKKGKYSLPIADGQTIFVIKPSGYMVALNQNNLPQYYYQYKPNGSPTDFKYKGSAPTGTLPKEVNFALYKQNESKNFDILVFGDPQPYTEKQLDYFKRAIVNEVKSSKKKCCFRNNFRRFGR